MLRARLRFAGCSSVSWLSERLIEKERDSDRQQDAEEISSCVTTGFLQTNTSRTTNVLDGRVAKPVVKCSVRGIDDHGCQRNDRAEDTQHREAQSNAEKERVHVPRCKEEHQQQPGHQKDGMKQQRVQGKPALQHAGERAVGRLSPGQSSESRESTCPLSDARTDSSARLKTDPAHERPAQADGREPLIGAVGNVAVSLIAGKKEIGARDGEAQQHEDNQGD